MASTKAQGHPWGDLRAPGHFLDTSVPTGVVLPGSHPLLPLLPCRTTSTGLWVNVYRRTREIFGTGGYAKTPTEINSF